MFQKAFQQLASVVEPYITRQEKLGTFSDLYNTEQKQLGGTAGIAAEFDEQVNKEDFEPAVRFAPEDRLGLALSGGGIRSATYNLGLLQGLEGLGLLKHVDYLATVSGGGYIGGWYSACRHRAKGQFEVPFERDQAEDARIRHLREFSKFLSPRVSLLEVTLWYGVVAILCGLVVGLACAAALIAAVFYGWICLTFALWHFDESVSPWVFVGITAAWLIGLEIWWWREKKQEDLESRARGDVADLPAGDNQPELSVSYYQPAASPSEGRGRFWRYLLAWMILLILPVVAAGTAWWHLRNAVQVDSQLGVDTWNLTQSLSDVAGWQPERSIFGPALAWGAAALVMILLRFALSTAPQESDRSSVHSTSTRAAARLIGLAGVWLVLLLLWLAGAYLKQPGSEAWIVASFTASSGIFAWLRNWFSQNVLKPRAPTVPSWLRRRVPQILGYLIVVLGAILVAILMIAGDPINRNLMLLSPLIVLLICVFFDPENMGLHGFYRDRIARAYLGYPTLQVDAQKSDDIALQELPPGKPIHLVCTALNGLADDPLGTLGRCARSAVLSRHGISIGNCSHGNTDITLASALTASAAAFNSNMGSVSSELGPAVTFTMAALNLRLGLWIPHPCGSADRPWLPGLLYLREMFGRTSSQVSITAGKREFIHLSDGGHFENLALYELVRRHCRFIIVSDCAADPEVKFDDLGNAARRVREDFGVDIEIDLEPLKPNANGISKQHMVVGTIHYDRDNDKGILLYFKSALTGNEPADVMQYKSRNTSFPHESTGDQFYDEAQWESYRRLGEHAVWDALEFVERLPSKPPREVFTRARLEWYPSPPDLERNANEMARRYSALEQDIRDNASPAFVHELFGELKEFADEDAESPLDAKNVAKTLSLLLEMTQFMEDVLQACFLQTHAGHPLNVGWFNLFQRWVYAPSFQAWWPILRPLYGPHLHYLIEERLRFSFDDQPVLPTQVDRLPDELAGQRGMALDAWRALGRATKGLRFFEYKVNLKRGNRAHTIQVGIVAATVRKNEMSWESDNYFIVPGLWGAGIARDFLQKLVVHAASSKPPIRTFSVRLADTPHTDRARRDLRTDLIELYASEDFHFKPKTNNGEMSRTFPS